LQKGDVTVRKGVHAAVELAGLLRQQMDESVEIDLSIATSLVVSTKGLRLQFGREALAEQWNRLQMVKAVFKPGVFEGSHREGGEVDLRYDNRVIVRERG
jgi:cell division protein FtsQ